MESDMSYLHLGSDCAKHHQLVRDFQTPIRPEIIVLCGSTRFRPLFESLNHEFTLNGLIVLTCGVWWADSDETKVKLDELHKRKIDLADTVFVVNPNNYIGESTQSEILYARAQGKRVKFLENKSVDPSAQITWKDKPVTTDQDNVFGS